MSDTIASETAQESPLFSVVIPSYNRMATIIEALVSVWGQDCTDLEVLVVDDGSTDDTLARLQAVADPRLRVIRQQNRGASAARNTGIDAARGTYVAFLDSDDRFLPHHLSSLLALLRQAPGLVAYTQVIAERGNNRRFLKPYRALRPDEDMAEYLLCDRGFVQTSGLALERSVAAAVRYREDVSFGDDTDFAIRLQLAGCRFVMAEEPSVVWMDTPRGDRLSKISRVKINLQWLDDLQSQIPAHAYFGYIGWHAAKNVRADDPWLALRLYLRALFTGAYSPRLAIIILLQIFMPERVYRWVADEWINLLAVKRRLSHGTTAIFGDGGGAHGHLEA